MSVFFVFALIGLLSFLAAVSYRQEEVARPATGLSSDQQPHFSTIGIVLVIIAHLFGRKRSSGVKSEQFPLPVTTIQDEKLGGDVTIVIAKRWAARVLIVAGLLTLSAIAVFWPILRAPDSPETSFQEFLGSRFVGAAIFGWFFGILFGYWFSSVLFRKPEDRPGYKEIAVGIVMTLVLLIGLGGQGVISQLLSRLNTVEIAGAKIGLDTGSIPKSTAASHTYAPLGRPQSTGPDQSQGLFLIEQLWSGQNGQIERDKRYVSLIARSNGIDTVGLDQDFNQSLQGLNGAFRSLVSCMAVFYDRTGDDGRIWQVLAPVASGMRKFVLDSGGANDVNTPSGWEDAFWAAADIRNELPQAIDNLESADDRTAQVRCDELPSKNDPRRSDYLQALRSERWRKNPYLFLATASLLAYGHEYEQAVLLLDRAISDVANPSASKLTKADIAKRLVYNIRLRGVVVSYMEEWLHGFNAVKATKTLLDYELNNLSSEIEIDYKHNLFDTTLKPAARVMQSSKDAFGEAANFQSMPSNDDPCGRPEDFMKDGQSSDWLDSLFLARSLVSSKLNWITVALDNPEYFDLYQHTANEYLEELKKVKFSCFEALDHEAPQGYLSDAIKLKTKDILEAYARLTFANYFGTEKNRELTSDQSKIDKLERAEQAVILATNIMRGVAPDPSASALLRPFASNTADQSKVDLENLRRSISAAIADAHR